MVTVGIAVSEGSPIRINFFQRIWSYLEPVRLGQSTSPTGQHLELLLVRNQPLLLTEGALYSDGKRYLPAVTLAKGLGVGLRQLRSVLVLGVGVGSIVRVLRSRGCHPSYTLVDKDRTVLRWAMETLVDEKRPPADRLEPVCQDADAFMLENQRKFDLVFIDVFQGRTVPRFATTPVFLRRCRAALTREGRVALNYLADDDAKWAKLHQALLATFPGAEVVSIRDTRILISAPMSRPARVGQP